ncbi:type II toxin-antitoxin system VapC family toxin [Rickettsia endosymbiont of Polydrusus tereticollis]|uniref:type II toxin-antitoxin system VapC family toxin n=1 Tax=Rickettsia endosymbiont of Polydrusus tereticollis TaxID=3066251 RepID=UPI003132F3E5
MTNVEINDSESLILDTHILIWYVEGIELSESQIGLIEKAREKNMLCISAISIWEIAMLESKGRIALSVSLADWIDKLLSIPGLNLIDLSVSVLIQSCFLTHYEHKDPADRFIIASARANNSYLLTFDQKIIQYANLGYLKIVQTK